MNSVSNLLRLPFKFLSHEDKVKIKRLGPDKPDIHIRQSVSDGHGKVWNRYFNQAWYKRTWWLCGCPVKNALFCFPCILFGGERTWTERGVTDIKHLSEKIKLHIASQGHNKNVAKFEAFDGIQVDSRNEASTLRVAAEENTVEYLPPASVCVKAEPLEPVAGSSRMAPALPAPAPVPGDGFLQSLDLYQQPRPRRISKPPVREWAVPTQTGAPVQKQPLTLPPPPLKKPVPPPLQASKPPPPHPVSPPQPPPPPPEVCLRWNSYHSNMQATFPSLLNNEQFVDVTLACEGRSIKCHKMMLSACSAYFEELLSQNPCQHPIVLMKDLRYWEVQALVDFMYRGEVNVGQDKLPSLLAAAEALQIKGLAGPASTSSSHDEDSLPPSLAMGSAEDFMDESTPSPSSSRRARKRRAMGSAPIPQPQPQPVPVATSRNPVGRPRLSRTSAPLPSTSSYHQESSSHSSEPPARRVCKPDTSNIMSEIKIEPIDIDIRSESMDPGDDSYMDKEAFDESTTADGGESSGQGDGGGGGENSVDHDTMLHGHVDRKTILHGHDSEQQLNYGNNNGMTSDSTGNDSKLQGYPYEPGNGPESSSPAYPEVVMNPGGDNTLDQC